MNRHNFLKNDIVKVGATVLALGALASCDNGNNSVVRDFGWVKSIQESKELGSYMDRSCLVTDGSEINIDANNIATIVGNVIASIPDSGTSCPEGTTFKMTPKMYKTLKIAEASQERFETNVSEANKLYDEEGVAIRLNGWFATVNKPTQTYRSISNINGVSDSKMDLGESCFVEDGTPVRLLGKLSTGDSAAIVDRKDVLGTPCPEGSIIILEQQ
jgi:hypothetical protein